MKIITESERLEIVIRIATLAHKNQIDKVGEPYIQHLERVANVCKTYPEKIVAYFHDICEDKHMTHDELEDLGILTSEEREAIKFLDKDFSHNLYYSLSVARYCKGVDEEILNQKYLNRIYHNELARTVKIADLRDNSDVSRFLRNGKVLTEKDQARLKKYERSLAYLLE